MKYLKLNRFTLALGVFLLIGASNQAFSQTDDQVDQAEKVLIERDISDDEVKRRLKLRGIDLDNIQPEQAPMVERAIKEVIDEIEAEKANGLENVVEETTEKIIDEEVGELGSEISERMKDGASVEEAISEELSEKVIEKSENPSIYGHSIFHDNTLDFYRTTSSSTTPDNYVLDVGDKIAINIFGASQADLIYQIEPDGFIRPTNMYKIYLKGVPFSKAKALLRARFGQAYTFGKEQFNVDLHTARTITVNITGEVQNPGSFTISALNTALGALVAAGGPNGKGSVRRIQVVSDGKKDVMDVYDYMQNPNISLPYLRNNATIYVPPSTKVVTLTGPFNHHGRFELLENERFNDLIEIAGGVRKNVYLGLVQLVRQYSDEQKITDYKYTSAKSQNLVLYDMDHLYFRSNERNYENFASIEGAVRFPGNFEIDQNLNLSSVLDKASLEDDAKLDIAYIHRKNSDGTISFLTIYPGVVLSNPGGAEDLVLQQEDKIVIYSEKMYTDVFSFFVSGAVRNPQEINWDPKESLSVYDAIVMSGGLKPNATSFGYIVSRPDENSQERTYKFINVLDASRQSGGDASLTLKANDQLVIPSKEDYTDQFTVSVSGAVRNPGDYIFDESLSLKDVLIMAGGLKMEASSSNVEIFRLKIDENEPTETISATTTVNRDLDPQTEEDKLELKPYDHIVVRTTPEFEMIKTVTINGEVKYPGIYALTSDNERISDIIRRAQGITDEAFLEGGSIYRLEDGKGYIVTQMDKLNISRKKFDLILKDGDVITIPKQEDLVSIDISGTGAKDIYFDEIDKQKELHVPFIGKRSARYYILEYAGGFAKRSRRGRTYVTYASGKVKKVTNFGLFRIYPKVKEGSKIQVMMKPEKVKKTKKEGDDESKERLEIYKGIMDIMAVATSALTVAILASRL